MGIMFYRKKKTSTSSEFSTFVREARSGEKKRVFKRVLNDSIDAQDRVIKSVKSRPE
jgi:hypothetical protein